MAEAPEPKIPEKNATASPALPQEEPEVEPEVELTLAHYFGGYAVIFLGVIGLALVFVLLTKLMR
jgi:hypothetical protein